MMRERLLSDVPSRYLNGIYVSLSRRLYVEGLSQVIESTSGRQEQVKLQQRGRKQGERHVFIPIPAHARIQHECQVNCAQSQVPISPIHFGCLQSKRLNISRAARSPRPHFTHVGYLFFLRYGRLRGSMPIKTNVAGE